MKNLIYIVLTTLLLWGCSEDRSRILKVYNWADYIDEALIDEFEQWYLEETDEEVEVVYQTFDINETMLSKIELGHEDYDLACPSDYIIERMLRNDLLLPIDKDFGDTPNYIDSVSTYIVDEVFSTIEGGGRNANDYSVGYMWGTTGILYNPKFVPDEQAKSWDVLRNPEYAGKILICGGEDSHRLTALDVTVEESEQIVRKVCKKLAPTGCWLPTWMNMGVPMERNQEIVQLYVKVLSEMGYHCQ